LANSNNAIEFANEELALINRELTASNEELNESQAQIESLYQSLSESEARLRQVINSSPVAMAVNRGDDLIFEIVNEAMLTIIGKDSSIIGKPWYEAIPEVVGTPIIDVLYHTYHTGEERKVLETPVTIEKHGVFCEGFYNINYSPLKEKGKITGIIQSVVEVTEQVIARNQLSSAYEQARLSKEAAELGTFDMDLKKGTMEWDARCRMLFGISHHDTVTYKKDFVTGLHPEDRERITDIIDKVLVKAVSNGVYDVEYRTIGSEDQRLRWVRAKGQAYFDEDDVPVRFIGSVLDITEQKMDDQRKNDFIGMVSHELKTPLTSLNALLQVTHAKLKNTEDEFLKTAMDKANIQVKKMGGMINGFLNISRLESGKLHLNMESFDLKDVIREVISEIKITVTRHQMHFLDGDSVAVYGDKDKISHVISNLLSNAIKYSPKGLNIDVRCEITGGAVVVSIKDEGMGIKEKDRMNLFNRYYRIESHHTQHISGFGIGLYLSAEIIKAHHGKIWVDSESGKGSTFYFSLPLN
jgi:two-component system sensor histidine kinase VicK